MSKEWVLIKKITKKGYRFYLEPGDNETWCHILAGFDGKTVVCGKGPTALDAIQNGYDNLIKHEVMCGETGG